MSTARSSRRAAAVGSSSRRSATAAPAPAGRKDAAARPPSGRAAPVRPASARLARARQPEADGDDEDGGDQRSRRPERVETPTSHTGMVVGVGVVALVIAAACSYAPIMRSMHLGNLDKAEGVAAIEAADRFLAFVGNDSNHVRYAVVSDRGPIEAQIHMAKVCKLYPALVTIADRSQPAATPEQLTLALKTAAEVYNPQANKNDRKPGPLEDWARSHENREVRLAAIALITAIHDQNAAKVLGEIAGAPGQDPLVIAAAFDGLADEKVTSVDNLGYAINLLTSPASDLVLQHAGLKARIVASATVEHLVRLVELLGNPIPGVRGVALAAMAGPSMVMPEGPQHAKRRQELGERIAPKITADTPPVELAPALQAARRLRLSGARDAVLALVPAFEGLGLDGIDRNFMSETLGHAFILTNSPEATAVSEELIGKLTTALADEASRPVVATALGLIRERDLRGLREAMDKLAHYGEEAACLAALVALVGQTFDRKDVVKMNGKDLTAWQDFLAKDRPRFDRFQQISDWYAENKQYQRVSDGKKRLGDNKNYIAEATEQLNGWMEDPKFVPPLGLTVPKVRTLTQDLQELGVSVRKAFSGALD